MIGWPPEFDGYVERSYQALKAEQTRLLHNCVLANVAPARRAARAARHRWLASGVIAGLSDVTRATALVRRASWGRAPFLSDNV